MKTTTSVVLAGSLVAAGSWAEHKKLTMRMFVGVGVLAVILAALGEMNLPLAEQFGALIVVAALLYYVMPIAKALGYTK